MQKIKNRQVTFYMDPRVYDLFKKKYPNISALFFRKCVVEALRNPEFFQHVFFEVNEDFEV